MVNLFVISGILVIIANAFVKKKSVQSLRVNSTNGLSVEFGCMNLTKFFCNRS